MTFVWARFLHLASLFFLFSQPLVVLKYSASTQRTVVRDCESTLNQQWDGKTESYLSTAVSRLCFLKKQMFLFIFIEDAKKMNKSS